MLEYEQKIVNLELEIEELKLKNIDLSTKLNKHKRESPYDSVYKQQYIRYSTTMT